VIVALLAVLLVFGCAPERPPRPPSGNVIVAAGDIASCSREGDEATARLVGSIDGAHPGRRGLPTRNGPGL
jgi:hypothetical protein